MSERIDREAGPAPGVPLGHVVGELPEGVVVAHGSGRIEYANPAAVRLWGYGDLGELPVAVQQFEPAFDVRDVDGRPLPYPEWPVARALAGEHFDDRDCLFLGRDGTRRRMRCAGGPIELPGGERGGWVSFRDVSREETILRELREERDLVGALVDSSPLAIAVLRAPELVFEVANDVFEALRPEAAMIGRGVGEVFPEAGPAGFTELLESVATTGEAVAVTDAPVPWLTPPVTRHFSFTFSRLPQPSGRPTRVLIMARESTAEVAARVRAEAIAAERTRDLSRARVTAARLRSLVDLSAAIASVEDLDALLSLVTREAARLLGADSASLFLIEERGEALVGRAHVGMADEAVVGLRIVLPGWPEVAEVLRTGQPAVHTRADLVSGPERSFVEQFGIRSYVAVRLGTTARPLGTLFVNYTRRRHRFSRPELAFVETLSSYLSVTIERARLVSVLREAVASLQTALLPDAFPDLPGLEAAALYRSASEVAQVGGDFYDLFPLADGRVVAVIGDVVGKGVAAARHTVRLRYELRLQLEDWHAPGRALTAFNRKVLEEFTEDEYATLLVVVLDPATGEATWSSAGHPPPLVVGPSTRTLPFEGAFPVGLFPEATYRTSRFTLGAGRCLLLYTDGVIEARSPDGHELGTDGLAAAVPALQPTAAGIAEVVLKEVLRHTGGRLEDDAAVLVVRRV